jgi:DNA-binding Lrp family transcriptional regulator
VCHLIQVCSQSLRQIADFLEIAQAAVLERGEELAAAVRGFTQRFDERDQFRLTQPG